jgi:hypothetical protein
MPNRNDHIKIEIEQYKNQTIEYDVEKDKFVCDITIEDRSKTITRQSLKDVRREIDQFVKHNLEFKKFKLFEKKAYESDVDTINVEGIRTDGKFTCKSERYPGRGYDLVDFEKEIRSGDEYYEYDPEFIKLKKIIKEEEDQYRAIISAKEKALFKTLKKFDLKAVKRYTDAFTKS